MSIYTDVADEKIKTKADGGGKVELLKSRVELLTGTDRAMMAMYLKNGSTFRQMAQIAGVNEASVARRIERLTRRLLDGEYITCLRNREIFSEREMAIARDYFVGGLSIRQIAANRRTSYYRVRQIMLKIQRLVNVIKSRNPEAA